MQDHLLILITATASISNFTPRKKEVSKLLEDNIQRYESKEKSEVKTFKFNTQQARLLHKFSEEIAAIGGPQAIGARMKASLAATELKFSFSPEQKNLIGIYSNGFLSLIIFEGLLKITDATPPEEELPALTLLENRHEIHCLAARNQILLKIVENQAFSYNIDNEGKLVRLVANFKGGGEKRIKTEPENIELSSHSGLSLGPHTEAPYWCAVNSKNGHSPSPSSLILSALWNPEMESTAIIPLPPILEKLGFENSLALTTSSFNFTRSDSFVNEKGEHGYAVSIIDFNEDIGFSARFNSYRFSVDKNAPSFIKRAYSAFCQELNKSTPYRYTLTQESAIIINNNRALHCRDAVKDNRRLLVRLFGISKISNPIIISDDPLVLRG